MKNSIKIRGYVSCVMGCPYEGEVKIESVVNVTKRFFDIGCYEVKYNKFKILQNYTGFIRRYDWSGHT